jgi:hypothetical protein
MQVRAKMKCFAVDRLLSGDSSERVAEIRLFPVYDDGNPENATWSKYTPSGDVRLVVTNPAAIDAFEPGKSYFVDFTLAD